MIYVLCNREFLGCGDSYFVGKRMFYHIENKQLLVFSKYPDEFAIEGDYLGKAD